jgi:hypothetical protein
VHWNERGGFVQVTCVEKVEDTGGVLNMKKRRRDIYTGVAAN